MILREVPYSSLSSGLFIGLIKCLLQGGAWSWVMYNVCGKRRDTANKHDSNKLMGLEIYKWKV